MIRTDENKSKQTSGDGQPQHTGEKLTNLKTRDKLI